MKAPAESNSQWPRLAVSARPGSTRSQNKRLPVSSPMIAARSLAAKRSGSAAAGAADRRHRVLLGRRFLDDRLHAEVPRGRGAKAFRAGRESHWPQSFWVQATRALEIDAASGCQGDVARRVAPAVIFAHRRGRQIAHALQGAEHAAAQGMDAEVGSAAFLVGPERRLVLVHVDLFEDHLFFGVEVFLAERGTEDVGQQPHGPAPGIRAAPRRRSPRTCSSEVKALYWAPISSNSRLTSSAERVGVALEGHVLQGSG